jgi:hypothetical protein
MTTPYPHAAKFGPQDLRKWNPATKDLPLPTVVYVYAVGTTVRSTLYTDANRSGTASNNPVSTGVSANAPGIDAAGNLIFYAEHNDYDLLVDGVRYTVRTNPLPADLRTTTGSGFDPSTYVNF